MGLADRLSDDGEADAELMDEVACKPFESCIAKAEEVGTPFAGITEGGVVGINPDQVSASSRTVLL